VGELLFADAQLGRLLDALDRFDLSDRTMVIVLADHGEGLGDHGEQTHGLRLYDTVLRIPLIVRLPAVQPRRHAGLVRIVDITPTVLDALRVDDGRKRDGTSLVSAVHGDAVDLDAYAESLYAVRMGGGPLRALRDGRYKLIDGPQPELYDLRTDPFEVRNIASAKPQVTGSMRRRLESLSGPATPFLGRADVPEELRQRLNALGYIGGAAPLRSPCSSGC
jgi:arylsulfatase A-like enzyme